MRQFHEQGLVVIDGVSKMVEDKGRIMEQILLFDAEQLEMELIELPILDLSIEGSIAEVYCSKENFIFVRQAIANLSYHVVEADIHFFAENTLGLSPADREVFDKILEALNQEDDIDQVYHNLTE